MNESELRQSSYLTPRAIWVLCGVTLLLHGATLRGYGVFRDELYYWACAGRLAFGYVDHPPLSVWMLAPFKAAFGPWSGDPLLALRALLPVAASALVWLVAAIAREMRGGVWAQLLAGLGVALSPGLLALFGMYSMNSFDLLFWAVGGWILVRLLRDGDGPAWLLFGAIAGLGLLNKISMLLLGFGLAVGLLLTRRWSTLRSPWLWLGGALAGVIFLPHVLWQMVHGWPTLEFMERAASSKNVRLAPGEFLSEQLLMIGPANVLMVVAGLGLLLFSRGARSQRALGWSFLAVLAVMLVTNAKPYYLLPAYSVLFAAGGVVLESWTERWGGRGLRLGLAVLLILGGLVPLPLARAVLPVETFVRYQRWLGFSPSSGERHEQGRLPQHFADMHGWEELAETVSRVYRALPADDREVACVFGQNYGEAGAIEYFAPRFDLPPGLAGHNNYYLWGPRGCSGEVLIVIGDDREGLEQVFERVEQVETFRCTDCMPYENQSPIWVVRDPVEPLEVLWLRTKHFN